MTTLTLSASSLGMYSRCPAAYRMYKVLNRRPVGKSSGMIAGTAIHAAMPLWLRMQPIEAQEQAIDAVLTDTPIPVSEKEHRTAGYIKDALAHFRAEHAATFAGWTLEEIEQQDILELGEVEYMAPGWRKSNLIGADAPRLARILWEFRRDLVAIDPQGDRWIIDWKTAQRDEEAQLKAFANSGQFMGYIWSWLAEHPDKPVKGVQPVRLIMRKPTPKGVAFNFPRDGGILFSEARVAEWRRHTLRKAREILERDPQDADAWPQSAEEKGCCRHQWGCCEYIGVCVLDPDQRPLKLSLDEFEDADAAKQRNRGTQPAPATAQ